MNRVAVALLGLFALACGGPFGAPAQQGPQVDVALPASGVPDRGSDPAVVAIDVAGVSLCAGVLLAADVVLTARRCVEVLGGDLSCPASGPQVVSPRDATTLRVLVGEDASQPTATARGLQLFTSGPSDVCSADVALLLIDTPVPGIEPATVAPDGVAAGARLRTVSFEGHARRVRDDLPVLATSGDAFAVGEAPCVGVPGGPAIDETTGDVVGVASRSAPSCHGADAVDVFARTDAVLPLIEQALSMGHRLSSVHAAKGSKGDVDLAAGCASGKDCAAGLCVVGVPHAYCTRSCGVTHPCPTHFRCQLSQQGTSVCVEN